MKKIDYSNYQKPSRFVKFEQGDTKVLIVSDGATCYEHGMNSGGRYIPLGLCSESLECEQCQKGNEPSLRYKWIAYLPEIGEVRLLSVGPQAGDEICAIGQQINKDSDKPTKTFEVIVNRKGVGRQTKYKVKKSPKSTVIDPQTAIFIKQSRDYLYQKYLT